jgi:hypothetical protein
MFTATHEHHEVTPAIEHRLEALEERVRCLEQSQTLIGPAEVSPNPVPTPGTEIQTSGFQESPPSPGPVKKAAKATK